ncbi:MAG: hypothetical protein JWL88_420 [Parcubacteria group bacterium]|nr:hypothetical protein [Parcubacteria group bacterium]
MIPFHYMRIQAIRHFPPIVAILLLALLIRLPAIGYGLPFHLIGDEETSVYGALEMIQLHTLLPVLHPASFTVLYEPPLLAYVYVVGFIPTLAITYLASGMHGLHAFASQITLDPSVLWYVGRSIGVVFGLITIYVLYLLARLIFKNECAALLSSLFLATSYLSTTIASTTRQWTPGTLCSVLALYFAWKAFDGSQEFRTRWLLGSGIALGLSFGFSYMPFYVPIIAYVIIYFSYTKGNTMQSVKDIFRNGLIAAIPFLLCAALFFAVDPYPFFTQVTHHVIPDSIKTPITFLAYYLQSLWNFETPLLLGSMLGIAILIKNRDIRLMLMFVIFFLTVTIPMYIFLPNIDRYLVPLIPMFSLLAGYGVWHVSRNSTAMRAACIILLGTYAAAVFGRYDLLLLQGDMRVHAKEWTEANIPVYSLIILNSDSDRLRLSGTSESIGMQNEISPESLRAGSRVLLSDDSYAKHPFTLFSIFTVPARQRAAVLKAARAATTSTEYVIEDSWARPSILPQIPGAPVQFRKFSNGSAIPSLNGLFIGGDTTDAARGHILSLLYGVQALGPDVTIYEISGAPVSR